MVRSFPLRAFFLFGLASSLAVGHLQCAAVPEPGDLRAAGKVEFPVSCASSVQSEFSRGVALLHSFFYEEARRVFSSVAERDPKCAMAQWGIAMTWWHPIWTPPTPDEMSAGKAAIEKAVAMNAGTDRERGLITALNVYYNSPDSSNAGAVGQSCHGPVGSRDRVIAYEKRCTSCATSIRTISRSKPSTPSRSSLSVMPRPMTRACRSSSRQPLPSKSCGNKMQTIPVSFIT